MQPFMMEVRVAGDSVVLTPDAREITFKNTRDFLKRVKDIIVDADPVPTRFILDLRNVEIIDSVSLGTLVALLKYARSLKSDIVVANVSEPIRDLFDLLHFNSVFSIFATLEDALKI
jgi:anti-anti-sigma factor